MLPSYNNRTAEWISLNGESNRVGLSKPKINHALAKKIALQKKKIEEERRRKVLETPVPILTLDDLVSMLPDTMKSAVKV